MAADFAQERRWKEAAAKKVWQRGDQRGEPKKRIGGLKLSVCPPPQLVRTCARHHQERKKGEERKKKEREIHLRHIASTIAREVEFFWSNIEQVFAFMRLIYYVTMFAAGRTERLSFTVRLWRLNCSSRFMRRGSKLSAYKKLPPKVRPVEKRAEIKRHTRSTSRAFLSFSAWFWVRSVPGLNWFNYRF